MDGQIEAGPIGWSGMAHIRQHTDWGERMDRREERRSPCTDRQTDRKTEKHRDSLAGALAAAIPAIKVVVEAGWGAAGGVTAAVVEEAPALHRRTLPPGVAHAQ